MEIITNNIFLGSLDRLQSVSLPNYEKPTHSTKELENIFAFSANTNQGVNRSYNEDRISIILNAACPKTHDPDLWPKTHFFGIFDGHGGHGCSEFLRNSLHKFILTDLSFPSNPKIALINGFRKAENTFLEQVKQNSNLNNNQISDPSGS